MVSFIIIKVLRQNVMWGRALLFTGILYALVKIPFITAREHKVVDERMDLYDKVAEANLSNAVVFIGSPTGVIRPMYEANLNRNDREFKSDVLYALDLGQHNEALMQYYPDRKFYLYTREETETEGILIQYTADSVLLSRQTKVNAPLEE